MPSPTVLSVARDHVEVSRRFFLQLGAVGAAALGGGSAWAATEESRDVLAEAVASLEYLTRPEDFQIVSRGDPRPDQLPEEKRLAVGLDPRTWKLEVVADPESDARIDNPLTQARGTALDWAGLMKLAEGRAVRFLKAMTCTNVGQPLGMGLWEGVPLRDVIWLARPVENVRRVFYYGYHNDDPAQRFQSSLPIGRVLEDPPGEHPVILCYKLNDRWLTPESGAPVRVVVPDAYGNKSVKWLQRIVLTNSFRSNDTYAEWNNDTDSHAKTYARFIHVPSPVRAGQPVPITGVAQVGMSGLTKVQVWLQREGQPLAADDPHFSQAPWQDAQILPPPGNWGGGLPDGKLPPVPRQVDPATGRPRSWPLRDTLAHWAVLLTEIPPGKHLLLCRTVDAQNVAQPMPRPFPKSGANQIQSLPLVVEA
jgi:DMSO/TMAO reductase YedYZ molybdopterin-dependent catalytic subunit